jgi:hypothetical protein
VIPPDAGDGEVDVVGAVVAAANPAVPTVALPDFVDEQAVVNSASTRTTARALRRAALRVAAGRGVRTIREPYKLPMTEP